MIIVGSHRAVPVEVLEGGTGFMMVQKKAFEKYSRATVIVAPQCVKRYYNYSGLKSYADRKRVGTEKFMALCQQTGQYNSIFRKAASGRDKLDDIAGKYARHPLSNNIS